MKFLQKICDQIRITLILYVDYNNNPRDLPAKARAQPSRELYMVSIDINNFRVASLAAQAGSDM